MKNELNNLIREAMLAKDELKLRVLRFIKTEFTKFETAEHSTGLTEIEEQKILIKMAIQICKAFGAKAVAVVSGEDKVEYCKKLGAVGCIDRRKFNHWGMLPHWKDTEKYNAWLKGARDFGKAIWDVLGEKKSPRLVFEHPGEDTIPTSIFVCDTGGMVVVCAGTTGYNATVDLRYLWMRQKRLQGSHFANDDQAIGVNNLVLEGKVDPCLPLS